MKKAALFLLIPLATVLSGCMMGPDYVKPKVNVESSFVYEEKEAGDTANTRWWDQFKEPVLDNLIAEALANNRNVLIAAANVEQALAVLEATRSPLFPQISYGGTGANLRSSESSGALLNNPHQSYEALSSASWEIDLWGRIRRLSEASQANLLATEEARRGIILSLVASVADTYIQLLGLDEQLLISKNSLATYGESVALYEKQFEYGQESQMTVEQARTQYETAAVAIPQIELQIAQTENALSILLGRNPGHISRGKNMDEIMMPPIPAGLPSDILVNRPDIRQAEQTLIAANAQIGAARALYFPSISLTGDFGYASTELSDLFKGAARTWTYSGSITGPIFTAGAISGQVKQAEAARKAALYSYELSIQNAFSDVENALITHRKLSEQILAWERLVRASKEYTRLAQAQYDAGYAPYSTVLQAQQQLFPAELNYAQARASFLVSVVNIYKAMGGGWITQADQMITETPQNAAKKE